MIPLGLFKSFVFTGGNVATFLLYAAMYGVVFFLPQFLQISDADPLIAGLKILPWTGTLVIVAPFAGKAVDVFGEKLIAIWGLILQGVGYLLIAILVRENSSYSLMILPLIISGVGLSMAGPSLQKAVLGSVDSVDIGKASGIYNVFRLFGGAVGTTISVIVFYRFGSIKSVDLFTNGFRSIMISAATISILGVIFVLRFRGIKEKI
ncbi:transport protein [Companilactobacillus tucceti DSM 20183]|uniref:Transport protein n=1 Tax=Companilactobacillus tucceti DSM 20183 TaxID=1423811 RepID=A0A0R1J609_9LACO|nr:transport protein [Companilactobacillus tucceti DSM 20183]